MVDCRDTINCKVTIVLCNGPWFKICSSGHESHKRAYMYTYM